ncbi:hypothetical protein EVJ58_g5647, partial [Rhodofomes roseus]
SSSVGPLRPEVATVGRPLHRDFAGERGKGTNPSVERHPQSMLGTTVETLPNEGAEQASRLQTSRATRFLAEAQVDKVAKPAPYVSDATPGPTWASAEPSLSGAEGPHRVNGTHLDRSSTPTAPPYASTGNALPVAPPSAPSTSTSARDAANAITVPTHALWQRRRKPLTPYVADVWEQLLADSGLQCRYPTIVQSFRHGFRIGIPHLVHTHTPPNAQSIDTHPAEFRNAIESERQKERMLGPFSRDELESLIGPFQTSPLSIIPKPHKPGAFRLIQNFSFPHSFSAGYQSINSYLTANDFPCTWGTFNAFSLLCYRLPPGSQAAVRDVAEAYRSVPLHPSQWPGTVVRLSEREFLADTNAAFGASPNAGLYGGVADAGADLMRFRGIGPVAKWVDDHTFFRILRDHLDAYNASRLEWRRQVQFHGGEHHERGRIWFGGDILPDGRVDEFLEDFAFPIRDLSHASPRSDDDHRFSSCMANIDSISAQLGIPWQTEKDTPFAATFVFTGFVWDLENKTVSLPRAKAEKYLGAISVWQQSRTHTLDEVQKLYGKLLHASMVAPMGRSYLTNLESMLGIFHDNPFMPRTPPRATITDLEWWTGRLQSANLSRPIPGPRMVRHLDAFSDASSGTGIAIVVESRWRAWVLKDGWAKDGRDIAWAEAVGFELLVRCITAFEGAPDRMRLFGDNKVVVGGWRNGRSRNHQVNGVFRRIHQVAADAQREFFLSYVPSADNPADKPSRGIYPPASLLLPPIQIPHDVQPFIRDADPLADSKDHHAQQPEVGLDSQPAGARSHSTESPATPDGDDDDVWFLQLRPPCKARDRLRRWLPEPTQHQQQVAELPSGMAASDLTRIQEVLEHAWADSTLEVYGSGLLAFHIMCDRRGIPEHERAPVRDETIQLFIATLAGSYNGDTIRNYVYGVRAWHILHRVPWTRNKDELETLLRGALRLTPATSQRKRRLPWTVEFLTAVAAELHRDTPLGAAVWACATVGFFSLARLGELTTKTLTGFDPELHATRKLVKQEADRNGLPVWTIKLPRSKSAATGESISFAAQDGIVDPEAALNAHFRINDPGADNAIFAYQHTDKRGRSRLRHLTKKDFLEAITAAAKRASIEPLEGHGMRIGGTLEYLLRGIPFDVVKTMGRWQSNAFQLYLRKHAQILAPYLQRESRTKLPGSSATCYLMSQLVEVVDAWIEFKSSGPGEASRDQFIAERNERVKQRLAFASLCEAWARVQDLARDSELADIKQERFEEILSRLRALGWGPELDFIKDKGYVPLADHQIVKVPRSLTDQAWNNVYDKLIGCMQDVRVDLANHSVEKLKVNLPIRWKIMERALRQLSLREHTEYQRKYGLVAADIALTNEYRDILGAPAGKTVTEATFLALGEQADSIVKDWLFRTREQLREVLLKEIEPPQNIDPLELATTVFVCGSCPPGFQFHFFPDICRAVCQRSSKAVSREDTYEDLVVGHCGPPPFRVSGCLRACHPTTRMREVIQFCGKNPDAVTAKEMNELDVRLVRDDIIMTWRCAMMEGLQDPHALNTWRLATFEETLKSQEHERRILAKGGQWYCMRCEPSPYLETLHDVEDHFRIKVIAENRTDKILNEYLALDFDKIPRDVFLSAKIPGIGVPCYLQDEVHHIAHAFWKLHKWQKDEAAALADKYTRRANRHREYASLCKKWADNEERMQSEERKAMVLKRLEDTVSRLRTLGWDKELDFIQARQYKPLSDHKFVRVGKRLSDQVWQKNEEEMVHLMENVRKERLEHEYTVVLSERWHVLESVVKEFLDQYLCDHPEILDYGFNIADLALTREYREVMCVPADQVVDRATFLALKGKTDTIVRRWRNNVRKHFHGLFAQYDVGTRNHSDPLDLATTLFIDLRSGQRVFFPQVVARNSRLATSKDGRDAYENMLRPLQPTGVEIMQEVIQLCGKDPATATAKAMDTLDVRLVDDFAGRFVTWRGAVTEASRGGAQKWRLASRHEMAKVKQHEMLVLNKEKLWACARCDARRLPVTRESQVFKYVDQFGKLYASGKWEEARKLANKHAQRAKLSREYAASCHKWAANEERMRIAEAESVIRERLDDIVARLRALNWGPELDFIQTRNYTPLSEHKLVRVAKRLTDRVWQNMQDEIVRSMDSIRQERLEHEHRSLLTARWPILESAGGELLHRYIGDHPELSAYGLYIADFALLKEVREVMCTPANEIVDEASFLALEGQMDTMVERWRARICKQLRGLFIKHKVKTPRGMNPLDLATTVFDLNPYGYTTVATFPSVLTYSDTVRYPCTPKSRRSTYEQFVYEQEGVDSEFTSDKIKPKEPNDHMRRVIQLCGKDPETATAKEMDALDIRLVSEPSDVVVTWLGAHMDVYEM